MDEPIDVYADGFQINLGPYGSVLNFSITDPVPPAPGAMVQQHRVATIRMSVEHLKVMTFIIQRQIRQTETQMGVKSEIPIPILNSMQISPEDWNDFWRKY